MDWSTTTTAGFTGRSRITARTNTTKNSTGIRIHRIQRIMAQINIPRLPAAQDEYSKEQINQMIQTLDQLIQLLNSSYTPEQLKNEDEAMSWFLA